MSSVLAFPPSKKDGCVFVSCGKNGPLKYSAACQVKYRRAKDVLAMLVQPQYTFDQQAAVLRHVLLHSSLKKHMEIIFLDLQKAFQPDASLPKEFVDNMKRFYNHPGITDDKLGVKHVIETALSLTPPATNGQSTPSSTSNPVPKKKQKVTISSHAFASAMGINHSTAHRRLASAANE